MKKILTTLAVFALSGCYTPAPTAQDVYVSPYVVPTVYYAEPVTTTYITTPSTPSVVYIDQTEPDYVFLPNPLIYGRPYHYHHHHHFAPAPRHHFSPRPHHGGRHHGSAPHGGHRPHGNAPHGGGHGHHRK